MAPDHLLWMVARAAPASPPVEVVHDGITDGEIEMKVENRLFTTEMRAVAEQRLRRSIKPNVEAGNLARREPDRQPAHHVIVGWHDHVLEELGVAAKSEYPRCDCDGTRAFTWKVIERVVVRRDAGSNRMALGDDEIAAL